jgi:hypothetical protein
VFKNLQAMAALCFFDVTIASMDLNKNITHLLLAGIIGAVSLGVSSVISMSHSVQNMAVSVQELNMRMAHVSDTIKDHESRLREVERQKQRR